MEMCIFKEIIMEKKKWIFTNQIIVTVLFVVFFIRSAYINKNIENSIYTILIFIVLTIANCVNYRKSIYKNITSNEKHIS